MCFLLAVPLFGGGDVHQSYDDSTKSIWRMLSFSVHCNGLNGIGDGLNGIGVNPFLMA